MGDERGDIFVYELPFGNSSSFGGFIKLPRHVVRRGRGLSRIRRGPTQQLPHSGFRPPGRNPGGHDVDPLGSKKPHRLRIIHPPLQTKTLSSHGYSQRPR